MLDWIKFFPYAARCDYNPSEVRGPYFSAPKKVRWRLGDSALNFRAPRSNPIFSFSGLGRKVTRLSPGRKDVLKTRWQYLYLGRSGAPENKWVYQHIYQNIWYLVGPWFSGEQTHLSISAVLITADGGEQSGDEKSLFHPRAFEGAVANILDAGYGYERNGTGKKAHYRGPLNWKVLPISSTVQGVVCDVHCIGNTSVENPVLLRQVYFPVSSNQLIRIKFEFGGTKIYLDKVCAPRLFELCDSIINSLQLDVGETMLAEWNKVKESCPNMSITPTLGEFPWPLKLDKASKKQKEIDITPIQAKLAN
ncbi:hypothetical protein [Saccharophagus degradans]|uniref:Uncharacterized protein n=1 Tax=Saccharophagus degradans TaxID=86304 RepID=A0AAW7X6I9_9GAMM|nr:hypothetical protein [Saccharophagus degradans]MDO6423450.1 hypothetical protein [Saccharophagus degradans]MDO6606855.1 hypothetical protein [Saccharophagus degradans]